MIKKYFICFILIGLIVFTGFAYGNQNDSMKTKNELEHISASGNSQGNIMNHGLFSKSGKWVYGTIQDYNLSRMTIDGKKTEKLTKDSIVDCVNAVGNYVFYRNIKYDYKSLQIKNKSYIYRMDIRTKKSVKVSNDAIEYFYLYNGKLYFSKKTTSAKNKYIYKIYQMNLDGSKKSLLYNQKIKSIGFDEQFVIYNSCIYFIDINNTAKLCKYNIKTKKTVTVIKSIPNVKDYELKRFIIDDNKIYFRALIKGTIGNLYFINTNGKNIQLLTKNTSNRFNVDKNWIYYTWSKDKNAIYELYKMKKDGTKKTKLSDINPYDLNIIDDWIFFSNRYYQLSIYKLKTDGTSKIRMIRN